MKKLLFFKSSSHGDEHHEISRATRDERHRLEKRWKTLGSEDIENKFQNPRHFFPVSERKVTERKSLSRTRSLTLRSRSLSMSSAVADDNITLREDLNEPRNQRKFPSSSSGVPSPLCDCSDCHFGDEALHDHDSSPPRNSLGSTSIPGQVLDLYIDGEHHQEKFGLRDTRPRNITSFSRSNSSKQRSDPSLSSNLFFPSHGSSRDSLRSETRHESPRKLAKNVIERLLMLEQSCYSKPMDITTIDGISGKASPHKDINNENILGFKKHNPFPGRQYKNLFSEQEVDDNGLALGKKLEEAKQRVMLLTRELAQEKSFQFYGCNETAFSQMIRNLLEEERNLVLDISDQLQCRIAERSDAKEAVFLVKEEMNSMIVKLEREKDELQSRLRELSEQNVSLQKEISFFYKKEKEYTGRLSHMDMDLKDITSKMDVARSENGVLQKNLCEIQDKLKVAEEVQLCMETNYKEKEKENTGLIKTVSRLQGTCSEQERTIDGLQHSLNLEIEKRKTSGKLENHTHRLQLEQLRLVGVEQVLRRQLETYMVETDSLRHENIYLLERLKANGEVAGPSALKLDRELVSSVQCLQNTGLSLLNENIQMSAKLLGVLKRKGKTDGFLEPHSLVEYDVKVQGFKQGAEQLTRSLGKTASVLNQIAEPANCESESYLSDKGNESCPNMNHRKVSKDDVKYELKAERLVTSLLKEKMYSKEKEVEQLQDELARALRNHDVLKSEIQNASDNVSCVNHKMKNLELQMIKTDGTINQLQGEVRSLEEELSATRGILSKVTQERDLMWEEVKQYSEKNMLLNCEINSLKKKMEGLEEDTLLKDGQISILKDSLNNARPFDFLLASEHGESSKL